jgi:hypothetical protein
MIALDILSGQEQEGVLRPVSTERVRQDRELGPGTFAPWKISVNLCIEDI